MSISELSHLPYLCPIARQWKLPQRGMAIGRTCHCTPQSGQQWYLRCLLQDPRAQVIHGSKNRGRMYLTHFPGSLYCSWVHGKRWRLDRLFSRGFRLCCCLLTPISLRHSCTLGIFNQTVNSVAKISRFNVRRPATTFREFPQISQARASVKQHILGSISWPPHTTGRDGIKSY